jgi:hypothetical protein
MDEKKGRTLYLDIASQVNGPLSNRSAILNGRGGEKKIPRCYHLKPDEIVQLKKEMSESGKFISPYGPGRIYTYILNALSELGENQPHSLIKAYSKFKELATKSETIKKDSSTLWDRFNKKAPRNTSTGRDPFSKFVQNLEVLQRLGGNNPYALKLAQVGACINILVDKERQVTVELRTGIPAGETIKPVNLNRKRSYTKTVDSMESGVIIPLDE